MMNYGIILQGLSLLDKNGTLNSKVTTKNLQSMISRKITADTNGPPFTYTWNYRALIGKLNYLEKSTRPDISYVVLQLARYSTKTPQSHGNAVKHLGCYLLATKEKGIYLHPTKPIGLIAYIDAISAGDLGPQICCGSPRHSSVTVRVHCHACKHANLLLIKASNHHCIIHC
jgi:hypothetical protein